MNIFKFIDSCVSTKQLPYVRLITVYLKDGLVTDVCICRYNDKNIVKKAKKVGLIEDKMMIHHGVGVKITNDGIRCDVSRGEYYLNYNCEKKDLVVYKS